MPRTLCPSESSWWKEGGGGARVAKASGHACTHIFHLQLIFFLPSASLVLACNVGAQMRSFVVANSREFQNGEVTMGENGEFYCLIHALAFLTLAFLQSSRIGTKHRSEINSPIWRLTGTRRSLQHNTRSGFVYISEHFFLSFFMGGGGEGRGSAEQHFTLFF